MIDINPGLGRDFFIEKIYINNKPPSTINVLPVI
jgi:hypothetical protein